MENEIKKRNQQMCMNLLQTLIDRGLINSADDALQKVHEAGWLEKQGYGHVAHALRGSIGTNECRALFADRKSSY